MVTKDEITLSELVTLVWRRKWLVIAITSVFIMGSIIYAKLATEWWQAKVVLIQAEQKNGSLASGLRAMSGLAGIAGINLDSHDTAEPIATLQSREFLEAFITEENLLPILFAKRWDAAAKNWKGDEKTWPDGRDGVRYFESRILRVSEDPTTQIVTLSVEWTDPAQAADWANMLVGRLNSRMRNRALEEAERNVSYLREELGKSSIVTLQESVARLLENEMQKMMVARGNAEYAFRVIDHAGVPKWRAKPKRIQIVILATLAGALLAIFVAAVWERRRRIPISTTGPYG